MFTASWIRFLPLTILGVLLTLCGFPAEAAPNGAMPNIGGFTATKSLEFSFYKDRYMVGSSALASVTIDGPNGTFTVRISGNGFSKDVSLTIGGEEGGNTKDVGIPVPSTPELYKYTAYVVEWEDVDDEDEFTAYSPTLTVVSNKSSICAGGIASEIHRAKITATLTDEDNDPIEGKTISFSVENSHSDYPASLSVTEGTTDDKGEAFVTLTSSRKLNATATVKATFGESEGTADVSMADVTPTWKVEPEVLLADGESTAQVKLTLTFGGTAVTDHEISWRVNNVLNGNDEVVYRVAPAFGSKDGYGDVGSGPSTTNGSGLAETTYTAGTQAGTIEFEALDYSVVAEDESASPVQTASFLKFSKQNVCQTPGNKPKSHLSDKRAKPLKINVKRLFASGTDKIHGFPFTLYEASYGANGSINTEVSGNPLARRMNANFDVQYRLMTYPDGADTSGISTKYTWKVVKGSTVKKQGTQTTTGISGEATMASPNTVGIYDLKHYVAIERNGEEKGRLSGETSEMFTTYGTPLAASQYFTRDHLRRVVGWAQNTNNLNREGEFSVPYQLMKKMGSPYAEMDAGVARGTDFGDHGQWWNVVMGIPQVNHTGNTVTGADCDDWASAHNEALALLGIPAEVRFVQGQAHPTKGDGIRRAFKMKGSNTPGWNFHAVSKVISSNYAYSITQSGQPSGTMSQMEDASGNGLVIESYIDAWVEKVPEVRSYN